MNDISEYPRRKHARLKNFDYSTTGAYFITICTKDKRPTLSTIVGRGLAPAVELTVFGEIAERNLSLIEEKYPHVIIDDYVIMPNHIHVILILKNQTAGASPRPTIMDIVCTYKSLTTRECKKNGLVKKMFQTSFYEHIIRSYDDYCQISKYIYENPLRWYYDELYTNE